MMNNAQKAIEERKKTLSMFSNATSGSGQPIKILGQPPPSRAAAAPIFPSKEEKLSKIALLQANIKSKLSSGVLTGALANANGIPSDKPTPLILDSEGRTVDVTGKEVQLTHVTPTLKANIRAKKRAVFKAQFNQQAPESISEAHYFDSRIENKPSVRNKRALRFHEPGKFQQLADRMRMKVNKICKKFDNLIGY